MVGRPGSWTPLRKKVIAGAWFTCSVCMLLMKQRSSAMAAVCGISALTQAPLWPCCLKGSSGASSRRLSAAAVIVLKRLPAT